MSATHGRASAAARPLFASREPAAAARPSQDPRGTHGTGSGVDGTVLVGGGPGGTAMLIAASRDGLLPGLARRGLTVVERGFSIGGGALHGYAINGDSTAETFLTVVARSAGPHLAALAGHPAAHAISSRLGSPDSSHPGAGTGSLPVPLTDVAAFLDMVGAYLARRIEISGGAMLTGHTALDTRRRPDGAWSTRVCSHGGDTRTLVSRSVVLATGARQDDDRLHTGTIAGRTLAAWGEGRLMPSATLLSHGGTATAAAMLAGIATPRIVVVGSSTSALAACRTLLAACPGSPVAAATVTLLHRRPLRVFYPNTAAALADGYSDFGQEDICPVSGFVYRLGGFRMEARDLVRQLLGVGGRTADPRLRAHRIAGEHDQAAARLLQEADLVIYALGYRPRVLPVLDEDGTRISLASDAGQPLVDGAGRVRDRDGTPIAGLYGLGLAAGFVPSGALGGEPSFSGNANGLWLWQNDLGSMIVKQIMTAEASHKIA